MSRNLADDQDDVVAEAVLTDDSGGARGNRQSGGLLASVALGLAVLAVTLAAVAVALQWREGAGLESRTAALQGRLQNQTQQLEVIEEQLAELIAGSQVQAERVDRMSARLALIDVNDADNTVFALRRLLIRQERDFRDFLKATEQGVYALHMMVPHSRAWWEEFKNDIDQMMVLSEARENFLFNLEADVVR